MYFEIETSLAIEFISFFHINAAYLHEFQHIFPMLDLDEIYVHSRLFSADRKIYKN